MLQPGGAINNMALKPTNARQSKRLFVHNLPSSATDDTIVQFFNLHMNGLNVVEGADPCISAQISHGREFALVEFKTPSDATLALALDGISMEEDELSEDRNGMTNGDAHGLSIRRPKDYIAPAVTDNSSYQEAVISSLVPETQNKVCITNLPTYLTDEQVTELLLSFGELKAFILIKDRGTDESRVSLGFF